ncbi:uncharacterized protein LOC111612823 [Centruroides sculpturatus]|uniref:uncharacterized protein LOC111612823 n=1 Tax=Centruroides sculpturatus TaxID=218467 RepID=UPI000C6E304B|nr:uncharacterized protein LOC111612823 [Centruroides sculpturatus]
MALHDFIPDEGHIVNTNMKNVTYYFPKAVEAGYFAFTSKIVEAAGQSIFILQIELLGCKFQTTSPQPSTIPETSTEFTSESTVAPCNDKLNITTEIYQLEENHTYILQKIIHYCTGKDG